MAYQNFYATKLSNAIGSSDTSITVQTPPTSITSGRLVLEPRNTTTREIISFSGVTGNQLTGVVRGLYGTSAQPHASGVLIEMNFLAEDYQDLVDAFNSFSATNGGGWYDTAQTGSITATNGNRSFDISIPTDLTSILSKGMRLKIPRTGTAVQTQVTSLNGSTNFWRKTTPTGMTFTDDFVAGGWVYLTAYPAADAAVISRYNGTSGWSLRVLSTGRVRLVGYNGGAGNYSIVDSYQSLPLNQWVHVAAQLDMSAFTATTTTSYVMFDGVNVPASVIRGGTNPTALVQAGNLEVGAENGTAALAVKVAQAFVSSAKITQANVRNFMNANITNAIAASNNIISAYAFDGNGNDSNTTNANNLTAQGSAVATNADSPFNANAYAIIMSEPVYGANTTMTVSTANGYPIPNATLGTVSYSAVKNPYGFPSQKSKWSVMTKLKTTNTGSMTTSYAQVVAGLGINLPIGEWVGGYKGAMYYDRTTPDQSGYWTLSTTTTTETNDELSVASSTTLSSATGNMFIHAAVRSDEVSLSLAAATQYYMLMKTGAAGSGGWPNTTPLVIRFYNAYL